MAAVHSGVERAVAADPAFPHAHSGLALALECLGYDAKARGEAEKAVELSRRLPEHIQLEAEARLYELRRQSDKALEIYKRLFERFPDDFEVGFLVEKL